MFLDIRKGDGLIHRNGSRYIADGSAWNRGNSLFDDWRVAAWEESGEFRFPIQASAIIAVWRDGKRIDDEPEQLSLFDMKKEQVNDENEESVYD